MLENLVPEHNLLYPKLAAFILERGYALCTYGDLRHDIRYLCVPFGPTQSNPDDIINALVRNFGFKKSTETNDPAGGLMRYCLKMAITKVEFDVHFIFHLPSEVEVDEEGPEPIVIYQRRMRNIRETAKDKEWTDWDNCSEETYRQFSQTTKANDWEYQTRKLHAYVQDEKESN